MSVTLSANSITFNDGTTESDLGFGLPGQTWQDLLASRAYDTTYTNTTSRSIVVSIAISLNGNYPPTTADYADILIDGTARARIGSSSGYSGCNIYNQTFTVKPNSTYKLSTTAFDTQARAYLRFWSELR
jgi:hypothetical protein